MKFECIGGLTLHYTFNGTPEAQPLVFINSLGTDLRIWDDVVACVEGQFDLLRYDLRGHGLSDIPPGPYSIHDHMEDLEVLLRQLGLKDVILAGNSVGGMIAMDYAIMHGDNVRALVLSDTAAQIGTPQTWSVRIDAVKRRGLADIAREIAPRWFALEFPKRQPDDYHGMVNMLARMPDDGYIANCEALRVGDLSAGLASIGAKSLVLCGTEDAVTPPDQVRELSSLLPDSEFVLVEHAGHIPCVEQPQIVAAEMNRFFEANGYG
jgi:3-oxoadipate enol-lactonase